MRIYGYLGRVLGVVSVAVIAVGLGVSAASAEGVATGGDLTTVSTTGQDGVGSLEAPPTPDVNLTPASEPSPAPAPDPAPDPPADLPDPASDPGTDAAFTDGASGESAKTAEGPAEEADLTEEAILGAKPPANVQCTASPNPSDGNSDVTVTLTLSGGQGGQYFYEIVVTKPGGVTVRGTGKLKSGESASLKVQAPLVAGSYLADCAVAHDQSGTGVAEASTTFEVEDMLGTAIHVEDPQSSPATCTERSTTWTVPGSVAGLEKFLLLPGGTEVTAGDSIPVNIGDPPLRLVAVATSGYWIASADEWTLTGGVLPESCVEQVTALAPTLVSAPTCEVTGSVYLIPDEIAGVAGYVVDDVDVAFGGTFTVPVGTTAAVEAYTLPASGFALTEPFMWPVDGGVAASGCDETSDPVDPPPPAGPSLTPTSVSVSVSYVYPSVTQTKVVYAQAPSALADTGTSAGTLLLVAPLAVVVGLAAVYLATLRRRKV